MKCIGDDQRVFTLCKHCHKAVAWMPFGPAYICCDMRSVPFGDAEYRWGTHVNHFYTCALAHEWKRLDAAPAISEESAA